MNKPASNKERNLIKGALRRVFSRSELRASALLRNHIDHIDAKRPRVSKWSFCSDCGVIEPQYLMEVDHHEPLIPVNKTLNDMEWNEVIDRLWCDIDNLRPLCSDCHDTKSAAESKLRKVSKNEKR